MKFYSTFQGRYVTQKPIPYFPIKEELKQEAKEEEKVLVSSIDRGHINDDGQDV